MVFIHQDPWLFGFNVLSFGRVVRTEKLLEGYSENLPSGHLLLVPKAGKAETVKVFMTKKCLVISLLWISNKVSIENTSQTIVLSFSELGSYNSFYIQYNMGMGNVFL